LPLCKNSNANYKGTNTICFKYLWLRVNVSAVQQLWILLNYSGFRQSLCIKYPILISQSGERLHFKTSGSRQKHFSNVIFKPFQELYNNL
jgi:hypothetical protein